MFILFKKYLSVLLKKAQIKSKKLELITHFDTSKFFIKKLKI